MTRYGRAIVIRTGPRPTAPTLRIRYTPLAIEAAAWAEEIAARRGAQ